MRQLHPIDVVAHWRVSVLTIDRTEHGISVHNFIEGDETMAQQVASAWSTHRPEYTRVTVVRPVFLCGYISNAFTAYCGGVRLR